MKTDSLALKIVNTLENTYTKLNGWEFVKRYGEGTIARQAFNITKTFKDVENTPRTVEFLIEDKETREKYNLAQHYGEKVKVDYTGYCAAAKQDITTAFPDAIALAYPPGEFDIIKHGCTIRITKTNKGYGVNMRTELTQEKLNNATLSGNGEMKGTL